MRSKNSFLIVAGFLVSVAALVTTAPASAQSRSMRESFRGPHGVASFRSGSGGHLYGGYRRAYVPVRPYVAVRPTYMADYCDDPFYYDDEAYCAPPVVTYRTYRAPRWVTYDYAPSYRYGGYDRYRGYPRRYSSYGNHGGHGYVSSPRHERGNSYRR